jgi:hypothetical protein
MSKNSKTRRDAKKKKSGVARVSAPTSLGASVPALLRIDGAVFATLGKTGAAWTLQVGGQPALSAPDAQTLIGVMQEIALRAEDKGYEAAVQATAKLAPLIGETQVEARYEGLAAKVLAQFPLPKEPGESKGNWVTPLFRRG